MANFKWQIFSLLTLAMCHVPCRAVWAKVPLPKGELRGEAHNELPAPYNLQAVVLKKSVSLTWQWHRPEELPSFLEFGFEIKRNQGPSAFAADMAYTDLQLSTGTYTYVARVRGTSKENGKRISYISDWSEPAQAVISFACPAPPAIEIVVEPTQKLYSSVSSLRFHLKGKTSVEPGCTLESVKYHLDTGQGIVHSGILSVDPRGTFDTFVNAFGPEDEIPSGQLSFTITATAENEAGPATSSPATIDVELRNPYAPR